MKELSTNFQVLEKGRVPLRHGLPQMSHIRGHGINAEDAEKTFSIVAPASRGQEDTVLEAELRAIEEMKAECTGKELGVEKGMGRCESTNAVKRNIYNRKLDLVAVGNTDEKATVEVAGLLKQKDVRALWGRCDQVLLLSRERVGRGGLTVLGAPRHNTREDFEAARKTRCQESDQGQRDVEMFAQAVNQGIQSAKARDIEPKLEKARSELIASGEIEQPGFGKIVRGTTGVSGKVNVEQQLAVQQTISAVGKARPT